MLKKSIYRKRRAAPRKRAAAGRRKSSVSVAVKKYVNRTIHSQIEDKSYQVQVTTAFGNYVESPDFNAFPCLPLSGIWGIPLGVSNGQRVGTKIKVRKLYLSYVLRPQPYDAVTNTNTVPTEVRLMLGYVKSNPSELPITTDFAHFFQSGSTSIAPFGNLRDLIAIYNKDYWHISKSWTHKLGFAQNDGTGGSATQQFFTNNDFKLNVVKKIDITNLVPKTLVFNDSTLTTNTKNLFFMYYAVAANGATLGQFTLTNTIDYWLDINYEDA